MKSDCYSSRLTPEDIKYELINLKQLVFEVTDVCNLACKYCVFGEIYSGFDLRKSLYLPFAEAKAIIDYLADLWNHNASAAAKSPLFVSFYGGEPLANIALIKQIVDYVGALTVPKRIIFSITSNCVLLDRHMDYLVENNFHLLCSLDGDRASDTYRTFHDGRPSFDIVFNNLKLLQTTFPEYFKRNVQFNAVLHNLNSVSGVLRFFKTTFDKIPNISELNPYWIQKDQKRAFYKAFRSVQNDIDDSLSGEEILRTMGFDAPDAEALRNYFSTSLGNVFESYSELLEPDKETPGLPLGTCIPFARKLFLKADGKILQCERIPHVFSVGVVHDGVVDLDFQTVADRFNALLDKMDTTCSECLVKNRCQRCFYTIDSIETEHFVCDSFTDQSLQKMKESYYKEYLFHHPTLYREFLEGDFSH